ncbi:hypothetical protein AB0O75_49060 [Streptomyces sp. NPDC088921]|uniref:hypothetical protein n=1 Tax=unclassified Streptomyces TaxID=2593676 RepID=UPI00344423A9
MGDAGIFAYRDDLNAWTNALASLKDPDNWARASHRAKARSLELSAAPDLEMWCDAIESLGTSRPSNGVRRRPIGALVDAGEMGPSTSANTAGEPRAGWCP